MAKVVLFSSYLKAGELAREIEYIGKKRLKIDIDHLREAAGTADVTWNQYAEKDIFWKSEIQNVFATDKGMD